MGMDLAISQLANTISSLGSDSRPTFAKGLHLGCPPSFSAFGEGLIGKRVLRRWGNPAFLGIVRVPGSFWKANIWGADSLERPGMQEFSGRHCNFQNDTNSEVGHLGLGP